MVRTEQGVKDLINKIISGLNIDESIHEAKFAVRRDLAITSIFAVESVLIDFSNTNWNVHLYYDYHYRHVLVFERKD